MARILKRLDDCTEALAEFAQPIITAMSTTGLTGGAMAAAGLLAERMIRRG